MGKLLKFWFGGFCVVLLSTQGLLASQGGTSIQDARQVGWQSELVEVTDALKSDRKNKTLLSRKGELLVLTGNLEGAESLYKRLSKKYRNDPVIGTDYGLVLRLRGRTEAALKQFQKVIDKHPGYAMAHEQLGDAFSALAADAYGKAAAQTSNREAKLLRQVKHAIAGDPTRVAREQLATAETEEVAERNNRPVSQQVINTMHSWVNAMNERDLSRYLSHYASSFQPQYGRSVEEWSERNRARFDNAEYIKVYLDSVKMTPGDGNRISVKFRELYESNLFEAVSEKEIILAKFRESWLIVEERKI